MKAFAPSAIVIWTCRIDKSLEFYRAIGLDLEKEQHEDGPLHYVCELGDIHFAIFDGSAGDAVARRNGGCTQIGFYVSDVDEAFAKTKQLGCEVVWEPRMMPWGRAALVCDPDGRPVELNQRPD
jgi:predicted enzyme related to lactoylglutathione lyase